MVLAPMKSTVVDPDGTVCCPNCGATSFTSQRTIKGKIASGFLAPKRLKCNGCGTALKRGDPPNPGGRERAEPVDEDWLPSGLRDRMENRRAGGETGEAAESD
jgi:hypothetical protein